MKPPAPSRPLESRAPERTVDNATVAAVLEHGPEFLAIARKYSASSVDADDAYQRSMEILMTKAPSDDVASLVRWLTVVVRNEALIIARDNNRIEKTTLDDVANTLRSDVTEPEEHIEHVATRETRVEAIRSVSADETRCLVLKAEGLSYLEIGERTGFSTRKVDRCLSKGRNKLTKRIDAIDSGSECERVEQLLSRMADGDVAAARAARPHLRNCGGCRTLLRDYRAAPGKLAAALPLGLSAGIDALDETIGGLHSLTAGLNERLAWQTHVAQQWLELGGAKKAAAIVAASTAIAGGGAFAGHSLGVFAGGQPAPANAARGESAGKAARATIQLKSRPGKRAAEHSPEPGSGDPAARPRDDASPRPPSAEQLTPSPAPESSAQPVTTERMQTETGDGPASGTADLAP